jgi:hypothetical protein
MLVSQGILSGLFGGILMGAASEAFYRFGIFNSSIFIIDGSFVTRFIKRRADKINTYFFGIPIHLMTSTAFGVIYMGGTHILKLDSHSTWMLWTYVTVLWISMLFVALPVAGQGFLGKKGGRFAWVEQLILHIVYGIGLWLSHALI